MRSYSSNSSQDEDGADLGYDPVQKVPGESSLGHGSFSDEDHLALWERLSSQLSLKPASRFNLDLPFQLNAWCSKLEKCVDAKELRRLCQEEAAKVNRSIESVMVGGITGNEVEMYNLISQMHFIQLVDPTLVIDKLSWIHPALVLCNWHHFLDASSAEWKLSPKAWFNRVKLLQINKVPIMALYAILGVSLTTSFQYLQPTLDALTLLFNILQKDLQSRDLHVVTQALKALTWFPDSNLVADNLPRILSLIDFETEMSHLVARKVMHVVCCILDHRWCTSSELGMPPSKLVQLILYGLKTKPLYMSSLCLAKRAVLFAEFPVRAIVFSVTGLLSRLIAPDAPNGDRIQSPWMQTKCLEILSLVAPSHPSLSRIFFPLVMDCLHSTSRFQSLGVAVACARAIGCISLDHATSPRIGVAKAFKDLGDLVGELLGRDAVTRKAALKMLDHLLPHQPQLNFDQLRPFLLAEVRDKSLEAVKLSVLMGFEGHLLDAIEATKDLGFMVDSLEILFEIRGYSESTIVMLMRAFGHYSSPSSDKVVFDLQIMEAYAMRVTTDSSMAPFRPLFLKAIHYIFSNLGSQVADYSDELSKLLECAVAIINLNPSLNHEILALESLWYYLEPLGQAVPIHLLHLRCPLTKFQLPLKYVILDKLNKLDHPCKSESITSTQI